MYYTYGRISREVYDYCVKNKLVDAALIAKWKKPGYERLCSTYAINPRNYKFGTVSICRVPKHCLAVGTQIEDPTTGCRGCASGPGGEKNIFGNKYGQYLAAIQIAREDRQRIRDEREQEEDGDDSDGDDDGQGGEGQGQGQMQRQRQRNGQEGNDVNERDQGREEENFVVGDKDGSTGKKTSVWAVDGEQSEGALPSELFGTLDAAAEREGKMAAKHVPSVLEGKTSGQDKGGPPTKRSRGV